MVNLVDGSLLLPEETLRASIAASSPILLQNLKQSATVFAAE
jgi:hypothetical protein